MITKIGPPAGGSEHDFEDESLVSLELPTKSIGLNGVRHGSISAIERTDSLMKINFWRSLKIVLFTAKINVLMPFGPLAILISYVTDDKVSRFVHKAFFSQFF